MKRTFVVAGVQFAVEGSSLSFFPTRTARIYQAGVGAGFALLFAIGSAYVYRNGYLADLIDVPDRFRRVVFVGMVVLAAIIVCVIYAYWKKSAEAYVFDAAQCVLWHGNRVAAHLSEATGVCVTRNRTSAESPATWSVCWLEDTCSHNIPLLTFELAEEASRVATIVAVHLKLPVAASP